MTTTKKRTDTHRNLDAVRSITNDIGYWIGKHAPTVAWTFEKCLKWREENVFAHKRWSKFPTWAQTEVFTTFKIYLEQLENQLAWTHVLDGNRVLSHSPETDDRAKDVYEQNKEWGSCYCYAFQLPDDRIILVPFHEEDRNKELESGRLTREDLQELFKPEIIRLFITHKRNGKPVLSQIVQLS